MGQSNGVPDPNPSITERDHGDESAGVVEKSNKPPFPVTDETPSREKMRRLRDSKD